MRLRLRKVKGGAGPGAAQARRQVLTRALGFQRPSGSVGAMVCHLECP